MDALRVASRALLAQQSAIMVTGENISNQATPGYSRMVARLQPTTQGGVPVSTSKGLVVAGSGTTLTDVERFRNQFLDDAIRDQTSDDAASTVTQDVMGRATALMGDTNESPLSLSMDDFFRQVSRAVVTPDDPSLRQSILNSATTLASEFSTRASSLVSLRREVGDQARTYTSQVNQILSEIAQYNSAVPEGTIQGNLSLDTRDNLVSKLSEYLNVQVVPQNSGTVAIYQDGVALVFGKQYRSLSVGVDGSGNAAVRTDSGTFLNVSSGKIGGLLQAQNVQLAQFSANLDTQATSIMSTVNSLLQNGYGLDGNAGSALFSGTGAQSMAVAITDQRRLGLAAASLQSTSQITVANTTFDSSQALSTQTASLVTTPAASGVIRVNGTDVAWDNTMSMDQILASFSAVGVAGRFDVGSQKIFLVRDPSVGTGTDVTVTDVSGNLASVMGVATATLNKGIPGDGTVAQAVANLTSTPVLGTPPSLTLQQSLHSYLSGFASTVSGANDLAETSQGLLSALTQQRDQYQGVSSDEETMNLMMYQRAYQAAARLATTQDQMLDTLINQMAR